MKNACPELVALEQRVQMWRKQRGPRKEKIPEQLWDEVARVARVAGVHTTSKTLGFNHTQIKFRMQAMQAPVPESRRDDAPSVQPAFVQLRVASSEAGVVRGRVIVELTDPGGGRMRVETDAGDGVDVVGMVQAFCKRGP